MENLLKIKSWEDGDRVFRRLMVERRSMSRDTPSSSATAGGQNDGGDEFSKLMNEAMKIAVASKVVATPPSVSSASSKSVDTSQVIPMQGLHNALQDDKFKRALADVVESANKKQKCQD
jgi:hypothetical protein